ncbi:hypothetical protein [Streptomyces sp. URMC 124]|uniref:hypothetical protein n=1 Tax=Streptomyces sp. URMC 124 TaxID=3423405 RepID=UPI003F1C3243
MISSSRRKSVAALAALAAGLTMTGVSSASASGSVSASADHRERKPEYASVTGSGEIVLPYYKDNDIRSFSFDAHADPFSRPLPGFATGLPIDARGTIKVSHYDAVKKKTTTSEGRVDCLVTSPRTVTLTAVITKVSPGGPDSLGHRVGFSVYDGGKDGGRSKDRVGFSWNGVNLMPNGKAAPDAPVGTCMAPAPYAPVVKGGYTVKHAELLPAPPKR